MIEQGKNWDKLAGNLEYFDNADIFVQDRKNLLAVLASFYRKWILPKAGRKVLDLGTGDGILVQTVEKVDPDMQVTASDGSFEVLEKAENSLRKVKNVSFSNTSFEEIIENGFPDGDFDFIMSFLAIHHLYLPQKKELFARILQMLVPGGWFLNIDTATNSDREIDRWYLDLWHEVAGFGLTCDFWEERGIFMKIPRELSDAS